MRESTTAGGGRIRFETAAGVPPEASLDGGRLTSDGGLPWPAEAAAEAGAGGARGGGAYRGYSRRHMYFPLLAFDGDPGHLVAAVLRPGTCHGSRFAVLVLRRLLKKLRAAWPGVAVEVRADSGFAV